MRQQATAHREVRADLGAGATNEERHTMNNTPSDEDIVALARSEGIKLRTGAGVVKLARAVLAKWGTLQPVVREHSEAEIVFAAISSGEWTVTRNQPSCYMTDEGNARNAWSVQRAVAPYCADLGPGNRSWNGPTALAALKAASKEMGIPLPITQKGGS